MVLEIGWNLEIGMKTDQLKIKPEVRTKVGAILYLLDCWVSVWLFLYAYKMILRYNCLGLEEVLLLTVTEHSTKSLVRIPFS